jgi:pyruvate/2-oxoglutarate dehydrogenase complex dihydrolipoamide acyltransferase (E2) component
MTVQIGQLESSLPTLDALDVEFGCKDEQCAAARIRQGDTPMNSTFSLTQSEFPTRPVAARPTADEMTRSSIDATIMRPSLAKRALRKLVRFLVVFGIGIATTLAWQSYGDTARAMIANSSPQLGWLAPQTPPVASTAPEVVAPAAAASPDLQQLVLGLASVRQSADQLAAQLAASQGQMGSEIAKLQADQQKILHKLSAASPRPAAAPAPKPTPVTPPPSPSAQAR